MLFENHRKKSWLCVGKASRRISKIRWIAMKCFKASIGWKHTLSHLLHQHLYIFYIIYLLNIWTLLFFPVGRRRNRGTKWLVKYLNIRPLVRGGAERLNTGSLTALFLLIIIWYFLSILTDKMKMKNLLSFQLESLGTYVKSTLLRSHLGPSYFMYLKNGTQTLVFF